MPHTPEALARLSLRGADIFGAPEALARTRVAFGRDHAVRLPGLLGPDVLDFVRREIETVGFHTRVHSKLASKPTDLCLNPSVSLGLLLLTLNTPAFLSLARAITGKPEIGSVNGTIHRRLPAAGHGDEFHSDFVDGRVAVLSINVDAATHDGGVLRIRSEAEDRIVCEMQNPAPGDAIVFDLGDDLLHRVTQPEGAPRTVFVGFFRTEPAKTFLGLTAEDTA